MTTSPVTPRRRFLRQGAAHSALLAGLPLPLAARERAPLQFDVRAYGAVGDGRALDTDAINRAIAAAAEAGGGSVVFPAGDYLSFSVRLKSRITLVLEAGATLIGADPALHGGRYDSAEPNPWDAYQDFGHSHWHGPHPWTGADPCGARTAPYAPAGRHAAQLERERPPW